jgi:Family of unknown function (DUF5994)
MLDTAGRRTATSPAPPSWPRLRLRSDLSARTLLDGGWWPRSADASRPRRLRVDGPAGSRVVRLGWFETMPAGLLTAIARAGRTDLLTVPPHTGEPAARAAMEQAAQAGNRTRTPALLAAITAAGPPPGTTADSIQLSTWEWEGRQDGARPQRAATSAPESPADADTAGDLPRAERSACWTTPREPRTCPAGPITWVLQHPARAVTPPSGPRDFAGSPS